MPMPPCFTAAKRPLQMVVYDPAAANKRARQEEATTSSSAAMATHAAEEPLTVLDVVPLSAIPPRLPPPPPPVAGREEPPCLRRHFLAALGLRADLPVHFIDDKLITSTDLDPHQNRFRIPGAGVKHRLRALLTPRELYDANLLHDPSPTPRKNRPRQQQQQQLELPSSESKINGAAASAAEGEQQHKQPPSPEKKTKVPKKQGKVHGGLRMKLVDLAAGDKELLMSRWDSSLGTVVKGGGYLDFVRRCGFREGDAVEIWAFVQRRVRLFGAVLCDGSLLHLLVVNKGHQQPPWCRYCCPPAPAVNPSTQLVMA